MGKKGGLFLKMRERDDFLGLRVVIVETIQNKRLFLLEYFTWMVAIPSLPD